MIIKIRDKAIEMGLKSIETEDEPCARIGGRKGFEQCRELETKVEFEERIVELRDELNILFDIYASNRDDPLKDRYLENYWRKVWEINQVEFVYEILKCVWGSEFVSALAVNTFNKILKAL